MTTATTPARAARPTSPAVGGPVQALNTFGPELATRGIVCGPTCSGAGPEDVIEEYAPHLWLVGPTPDRSAALAAELVANLAGPGPAVMGVAATPRGRLT